MAARGWSGDLDVPDGVTVQEVGGGRGRGLVATVSFVKGETLFREKPIVSAQFCWNRDSGYLCCHLCMEPLETTQENVLRLTGDPNIILPEPECCPTKKAFHASCPGCGVAYCSEQCLEDAWGLFHATLCAKGPDHPLNALTETWKKLHYPPETASITLLVRILASVAQSEDLASAYLNTFLHSTRESGNEEKAICHKLLGDRFECRLEVLRSETQKVFGGRSEAVEWFLSPEGFCSLFAMVGRNGQGIGTSPLAQWVKNVEKRRMGPKEKERLDRLIDAVYSAIDGFASLQFINNEGSGLYVLHSAANHSCEPSAVVEFPFNSHELVVNAARDISVGEEVFISYLDECDRDRGRHSRRKILAENYLFDCKCTKCAAEADDDPGVTSDEEMSGDEEEEENAERGGN